MSKTNVVQPSCAASQTELPPPASAPLDDCTPEQQIEKKYLEAIKGLIDPDDGTKLRILADVLAWTLARMVVAKDSPWIAGDIIRRFGDYTCKLHERVRAADEAEKAREDGHQPH